MNYGDGWYGGVMSELCIRWLLSLPYQLYCQGSIEDDTLQTVNFTAASAT